ncbi:hypothetical protein HanIR_Chr17g0887961 [Helianthus annuus]|nr:hypothetical protein HanIR_Chr17g0887961 [Helianthus annuus]
MLSLPHPNPSLIFHSPQCLYLTSQKPQLNIFKITIHSDQIRTKSAINQLQNS